MIEEEGRGEDADRSRRLTSGAVVEWSRQLDDSVAVWEGSSEGAGGMFLDSTPYAVHAHHCAHALSTHADQTASPVWVNVVVGGCILAVAALSAWLLHKKHHGPDDSGGPGGSGGPPPEPHLPDEPTWWPAFEREFAAYAAGKHEHDQRPARVGSGASPG